MTKSQDIRWNV